MVGLAMHTGSGLAWGTYFLRVQTNRGRDGTQPRSEVRQSSLSRDALAAALLQEMRGTRGSSSGGQRIVLSKDPPDHLH